LEIHIIPRRRFRSALDVPELDGPSEVSVTVAVPEALFARRMEAGEIVHATFIRSGSEQVKTTVLLILVNGAMVIVEEPFWPAVMVNKPGFAVSEKSGRFTATKLLDAEAVP
jgi:hypothetical protein